MMWRTFLLVFIATRILLLFYLGISGVGLLPDEAQYWTWSRDLAIGYYSKPPGIAWQIALSEALFSQFFSLDIAIRMISLLLLPFFSSLLLMKSVEVYTKDCRAAFTTGILYLVSPLGFLGSALATTDGVMVLACCGVLKEFVSALATPDEREKYALRSALWIFVGSLWKWTTLLCWPIFFYQTIALSRLPLKKVFLLIALSLLGLVLPTLWNMQHGWVTFRHVEASLMVPSSGRSWAAGFEFLAASSGLVSWGVFLIGSVGAFLSWRKRSSIRLLVAWAVLLWGGLLMASWKESIQGNWALIVAPMWFFFAGIGLAALTTRPLFSLLTWTTALVSIASQVAVAMLHLLPYPSLVTKSPLAQGIGCQQFGAIVPKIGTSSFLLSDKYQNVAQLERYAPGFPKDVYFMNLWNLRRNHYSLRRFDQQRYIGKSGLFVAIIPAREGNMLEMRERKYREALHPYFQNVVYEGVFPLTNGGGIPLRLVLLFRCEEYNGVPFPNRTPDKY